MPDTTNRFHAAVNPTAQRKPALPGTSNLPGPCRACTIRELSVCSALSDAEISSLEAILSQAILAPGQTVFYEGDAAEHVYNITSGTVRLSKLLADGRRQVTGFLMPGDFLGFASEDAYTYTAEAVGDVNICRFAVKEFEALFERFPQLERRLLARASNELAEAQDQMMLLGRKSPVEKLASFLLRQSERLERMGEEGNPVRLAMGRSDIADYLGLTVETVSRSFTKLRKDGLIGLPDPNTVVLSDLDGLTDLVE
ncbi:MAG TPA: cyclic nucleotide-binding domain-containing protein [Alphaproteobacteria bacterium]|jgi:CRP/FNR family transcriptional regulator|nr:cyclic nucleotide-binding domain-containing protein [Alphaproteobacteria bacterium]